MLPVAIYAVVLLSGPQTGLPSDIKVKTESMVTAFKHKDTSWLKKNATPDFVAIEKGQKFGLSQSIEQMKMTFQITLSISKVSANILSFKKAGSSYVVRTDTMLVATVKKPDGKPGKLVDESTDDMTWVQKGGSWKVSEDKTIKEHVTLDGKPLAM